MRRYQGKMFQMGDIINLAIQIEKNAEDIYRKALSQISNPSLKLILQWLADEEVAHADWFSRIQESMDTKVEDPAVEAMGKSLLSDILGKQSFSLKEAEFCEMDQLADLLSLAIEFENDKVLFYKMLRPFIADDETLEFLDQIIAEETHHIQELHILMGRHVVEGKIESEK